MALNDTFVKNIKPSKPKGENTPMANVCTCLSRQGASIGVSTTAISANVRPLP